MLEDLTKPQRALAGFMSDLSEIAFSAAWIDGLEYALWEAVAGELKEFGRLTIGEDMVCRLKQLAQEANGWIYYDEIKEETFLSFSEWEHKRKERPM